jgi:hypothetical protein
MVLMLMSYNCALADKIINEFSNDTLEISNIEGPVIIVDEYYCSYCLKVLLSYLNNEGYNSKIIYQRDEKQYMKKFQYYEMFDKSSIYYYTSRPSNIEEIEDYPILIFKDRQFTYEEIFDDNATLIFTIDD